MLKMPFYLKIIVIILVAYILSNIIIKEVFIAGTPRMKTDLDKYVALKINSFFNDSGRFIAGLFNIKSSPEQQLNNIPFKTITKGVYAKTKNNISYTLIKDKEVEWVSYTIVVKGKKIEIQVPKGQNLPPKEVFE